MSERAGKISIWDSGIVRQATLDSVRKLDPRIQIRNPVMFVTMIGAILTTIGIFTASEDRNLVIQIALWLWFTVLFANFAEAVAEPQTQPASATP